MIQSPSDLVYDAAFEALKAAFGRRGEGVDPQVRPSAFADFQVNAALGLARELQRPPRDIASDIAAALAPHPGIGSVEVSGPGYVNVTIDGEWLGAQIETLAKNPVQAKPPTQKVVVVDYSSPNVAKTMHVGHLRTTVVGDALARIHEFQGDRVIRQNHIGDWGTPFGMIIEHLRETSPEGAAEHPNETYRAARRRFDEDPEFAEGARLRVVALQSEDAETLSIWQRLVAASVLYFQSQYERLGISLTEDDIAGESSYRHRLQDVCDSLEQKGLARRSDGALCVFPDGFTARTGEPLPLIVRKSDGGFGYATTDLAAIRHRVQELGATDILYVVGEPQHQHFEMVFETAREAGWLTPEVHVEHVAIGNVLGADGKMLRTRSGETTSLSEAVEAAISSAREVLSKYDGAVEDDVLEESARAIGVGALKFSDLITHHDAEYVFDLERMLQVQGRTGPYVQYAATRLGSLLAKVEDLPTVEGAIVLAEPEERDLAMLLAEFDGRIQEASAESAPHVLAEHLADLARLLNAFYDRCPILKETDQRTQSSRIALAKTAYSQMKTGAGLLGLDIPRVM